MKNRLISDEYRDNYIKMSGGLLDERRQSGRSLGIALRTVGNAMCSPGTDILIVDHYYSPDSNKIMIHSHIQYIINKLQLKFLDISKKGRSYYITYNVFKEEKFRKGKDEKRIIRNSMHYRQVGINGDNRK